MLAVDPQGLGGAVLRAQAGPVRDAWLAAWRSLLPPDMPLLRLPHHISDDRLLGGLDLAATLAAGRPLAQAGLLAAANGGALQVAMAERLSPSTAAHLCAVMDTGAVRLERDGLALHTPSRFALLALDESLPEDAALSPALADRLGLWLDLTGVSVRAAPAADAKAAAAVQQARALFPQVQVDDTTLQALCAAALALGVHSGRATWFALRATRAAAALQGRLLAQAEDAALAVQLVLAGRATQQPALAQEEAAPSPSEEPAPPPADDPAADRPPPESSAPETPPPEPPEDSADPKPPQEAQTLEDQLIAAAHAAMPAGLLATLARLAQGAPSRSAAVTAGRAGASAASRQRGRPLGARAGAPHAGARLHLMATLRAAAPWQRLRRQALAAALPTAGTAANAQPRVLVRAQDFHVRRFEQRRTTTTVFAIDASGSSALHRLAEAKGAVELLLAECYVRRDEVAVLSFRGTAADVLLPPTRSLVRAKRSLAGLPGGGGTPLASGIDAAAALAQQVRRRGATPVVVLLTDGRANVSRAGQGGRAQAQQDALAAARALRQQGGHVLLIDTSPRPEPAALALAVALGARYLALPQADAQTLSRAVAGRR